jgi:hypothetical protein
LENRRLRCLLIDFATFPGGIPSEGLLISNQYAAQLGVTFALENGTSPVLAEVGSPRTAIQGPDNSDDTPTAGQSAGQFFLTDDGVVQGMPSALIVTYGNPVSDPQGVIFDIDGAGSIHEEWTITARDTGGAVIDTVVPTRPTTPGTGEGLAAAWSFSRAMQDIKSIRFAYTGNGSSTGLAFDNFSPSVSGQ